MQRHLSFLALALFASPAAFAQTAFVVLKNGDAIPGVGTVTGLGGNDFSVEIADDGTWFYSGRVDPGNKSVLIRGGSVTLQVGDPTPGVAGSTVNGLGFSTIDSRGETAVDIAFSKPGNNGEGIFRGNKLVVQRDQPVVAAGWPAGTVYADVNGVQLTSTNRILLAGICGPVGGKFLSVLSLNAQNNLLGESLVARIGAQLPGQPAAVNDLADWPNRQSINDAGEVLYSAGLASGGPGQDGAVMLWSNGTSTVLARDGQPSALAGTTWLATYGSPCAMGDNHKAFLSPINDFREVLVKDGVAFKVIGAPFVLSGGANEIIYDLGISNRCMSKNGELAWYVATGFQQSFNEGIFVDNQLLVQKGVTPLAGSTPSQMIQASGAGGMSISPNGRFVIFHCVLAPVVGAIVVVDRFGTGATTVCAGDGSGTACPCGNNGTAGRGCANSANASGARLTASGTASIANDSLVLSASGMSNGTVLFFEGTTSINAGAGIVFGDGLRCVASPTIRLGTKLVSGGNAQYPAAGDPSVSVKGLVPVYGGTRLYQAWYRDSASYCTSATVNLSNAISVLWMP